MSTGEKIISDFHSNVVFFTHHMTGERMVTITNKNMRPTIQTHTVVEAAKRILNYKRMNNAIRKARIQPSI